MDLFLLFHLNLNPNADKLIMGRLLLINAETKQLVNIYQSSSGLPGYQDRDNLATVGKGSIPPQDVIGITYYKVATTPLSLPNVKGVEGNFYSITPSTFNIKGTQRGDFGVHFDANVPGSSGCIVLETTVGWEAFKTDMSKIATQNITEIPLLISYTQN